MSIKIASRVGAASLAAALAAPAFAGPTYTNNTGGTFTWYGQFDPAFTSYDDGVDRYNQVTDYAGSNSRIGFRLSQDFGQNTFGFRFETAFGLRGSDSISQTSRGDKLSWDRTNIRHVDFSLKTANYGTFSAGQGSMASDDLASNDLSGSGLVLNSAVADPAGGYAFRDAAGNLTAVSVGDIFTDYDGGRLGRVRYDSPELAGFTVSASYGTDILNTNNDRETYDVAVRYGNDDLGDFALEAALGAAWTEQTGRADRRDVVGSVSLAHKTTGLSVSLTAGERDIAGSYGYAKIGYDADLFAFGSTAFAVDYYDGSDLVSNGDSAESWGIGAVQKIDSLNVEAYVAYRDYSYADTTTSYQDSNVILAGARWKF